MRALDLFTGYGGITLALKDYVRPIAYENVPAIRTRGLEQVVKEFVRLGYDCRWTTLYASSIGAPHERKRWFLLAHANSERLQNSMPVRPETSHAKSCDYLSRDWWTTEPNVGRVVNGVAFRAHRIKALGNGVVPLQVLTAFKKLMGLK